MTEDMPAHPEVIEVLDDPVTWLPGVSNRTKNALRRAGYQTVGQVLATPAEELKCVRHLGDQRLRDLIRSLKSIVRKELLDQSPLLR